MQRRTFIFGGLATLLTAPGLAEARARSAPRLLCLYHTHTEESLEIVYRRERGFLKSSLRRLNHFLRDFRTDQVKRIDPHLFDLLHDLQRRCHNHDGVFEIISGYRSPETNALLRQETTGVARHSLHIDGRALDIRLRGTSLSRLRSIAVAIRRGGVGYYPSSDFVHVDTGGVRYW
jgi:uncharacterized protein YcbK (DUF882 family)